MPLHRPLSNLAAVTCGYHYRARVVPAQAGEWRVAQGREVRADLTWALDAMPRVVAGPAERRARLKAGDVLVLARGERPYAIAVPDWPWPTLASSSFHIVRARRELLLPEYLAWYLNTPEVVARLLGQMRGKVIKFLPRATLADLEISAPTLARQQAIAVAGALVGEESRLHAELTAERIAALAGLVDAAGEGVSRAAHIRVAEAQLEVVRERLSRGFVKVGLG